MYLFMYLDYNKRMEVVRSKDRTQVSIIRYIHSDHPSADFGRCELVLRLYALHATIISLKGI